MPTGFLTLRITEEPWKSSVEIIEQLCPKADVLVLSRSTLVHIKVNEIEATALKFRKVAEIDPETLNFPLKALNFGQKQSLFKQAIGKAKY